MTPAVGGDATPETRDERARLLDVIASAPSTSSTPFDGTASASVGASDEARAPALVSAWEVAAQCAVALRAQAEAVERGCDALLALCDQQLAREAAQAALAAAARDPRERPPRRTFGSARRARTLQDEQPHDTGPGADVE